MQDCQRQNQRKQDPATTLATVLGLPPGSIPTGQALGKVDIVVKK